MKKGRRTITSNPRWRGKESKRRNRPNTELVCTLKITVPRYCRVLLRERGKQRWRQVFGSFNLFLRHCYYLFRLRAMIHEFPDYLKMAEFKVRITP